MDSTSQLGEKSVVRLLFRFSLPSIVAMLVSGTYSLINMSFLGNKVGPQAIAAIAVSFPFTITTLAVNMLIGNGCAANVSLKLGEGDTEGARELVGNAFLMTCLICLVMMTFGQIFLDPILRTFGASPEVLPYARSYMRILLWAVVFQGILCHNPLLRAEGKPMYAMLTMLISTFVNLALAPVFIFVFGWGIRGAAFASLLAQLTTSVWILAFLISEKRVLRLQLRYIRINLRNFRRILLLGLPTFFMQLATSLLSAVMNNSLGLYGGDIAISSWGILNSLASLLNQPIFGINQGAQPIIGYNYGAKKYDRVKKTLLCTLTAASFFSSFAWALTRLFPTQLLSFFSDNPDFIETGSHMIRVFMSCLFIVGFQQVGASYFQFVGKARTSLILSLSRQVFLLIPCLLILSRFFGMQGILISGPISDTVSAMITGTCVLYEFRRLSRKQIQLSEAGEALLQGAEGCGPAG